MHADIPAQPIARVSVTQYVQRVRQRVRVVRAIQALALGLAVLCACFVALGFACPPVLTQAAASGIAAGSVLLAMLASGLYLRSRLRDPKAGVPALLEALRPTLGSRLRSALELRAAIDADADNTQGAASAISSELAAAHVTSVEQALGQLPETDVVPLRQLRHWTSFGGLACLVLVALLTWQLPRLRDFAHALLAPAAVRADGTRIAPVVAQLRVKLSYPAYLARPSHELRDPRELRVPRGTSIELHVDAKLPLQRASLWIGKQALSLRVAGEHEASGRFTAQTDGELRVQLRSDDVDYEDPRHVRLHVEVDKTPVVTIESPNNGALFGPNEPIALRFSASDDAGLAGVELHVRLANGDEQTRLLWSALDDGGIKPQLRASTELVPSAYGAKEGDSLALWLEARDEDLVTGPNLGKSEEVLIEIASDEKRLAAFIPDLQAVADAAVDRLGTRLSQDVPREAPAATTRFNTLEHGMRAWLAQIESLITGSEQVAQGTTLDTDQLRGVKRRNQHLLDEEAKLYSTQLGPFAERTRSDERASDELERDVILLADLLAKAHVDEASQIANELRDLKKKIEKLLGDLNKTKSAEAERELMAEIARAERRLAELSRSLSRMATRVPSEFINREALQEPEANRTLSELAHDVQGHDLRSAAEHLDKLAKQLDELASQIGKGGVRLRESRFGPRDQALAEARQKLDMLSQEQSRLAGRSRDMAQGASQRGGSPSSGGDSMSSELDPLAQSIGDQLGQLGDDNTGWESSALERGKQRLQDARDAMRSGDRAEAQAMAEATEQNLRAAAAQLQNEASMFGPGNPMARRAELANKAAQDASRLSQALGKGMPSPQGLSGADREKLRGDGDAQRKAREAAQDLQQKFDHGPDDMPLSPEGADAMERAREAMGKAEQALQHGNADQAANAQADASKQLQQLAKKLADEQRGQSGGGGKGEGSQSQAANADTQVHIPGADEFKGPAQRRRKLLDAMRESAPSGFEASVQRYYEELLR